MVLRAPSAYGDVYLKCSADLFRHEAVVTRALAERMPGLVPEVVAVDLDRGWMLMRDLGAAEMGDQDESLWHEGAAAHGRIQRSWLGRADELVALGLPVRSLAVLAAEVDQMTEDAGLLDRMSAGLRERWLAAAPALVEACRRLDGLGPGPSLVHGDFHPWNVTSVRGTRVFDWTDAAVSHPFVDLATYVFRSEDAAVRRHLVAAYLGAWPGWPRRSPCARRPPSPWSSVRSTRFKATGPFSRPCPETAPTPAWPEPTWTGSTGA